MQWAYSLPRWLAVTAAGLLSVSLVTALVHTPPDKPEQPPAANLKVAKPTETVPLFAKTQPAANPTELVLLPDETGLRGWVAGDKSFAGAKVAIKAGSMTTEAVVRDDNTFAWPVTVDTPRPVTVELALGGGQTLTARTTLPAKPEGEKRSAFIITDRSAYRPGHTLKFAAYLHGTADGIDFKPLANREFLVELTSETQGTCAARLKLRSDAQGRLAGQYTFSDADSLDHYRLDVTPDGESLPLEGYARVLLGEYRKTKVGLKLKGDVKGGKLILTFDARDYLDRPVKGSSASWSAVVTKSADVAKLALDPTKFIAYEGGPPSVDDFNALPDDERLLTLAHGVSAMSFAGFGARTIATREGKVEFTGNGDKPHAVMVDLWPEWLKGQHSVTVNAVFLDETGRENRATGTFSLTPAGEKSVLITSPKELYAAGERVPVTVTPVGIGEKDAAATTVIVVRLDAGPNAGFGVTPAVDEEGDLQGNTAIPPLGGKPKAEEGWKLLPVFDPVKRSVLTVSPVVSGKADVELKRPGAYKLLAVTKLADGTVLLAETGVVVKSPGKLPGVILRLDARELSAGGHLTGVVHARFAGARLLLALRDAAGVKLMKPLTAGANGVVRFDEVLPPDLRYGCSVCAQYVESEGVRHADQHDIFVIPTDRTISISTAAPETVDAGAEVKLNFQVDRQEEVDLIVSVFDESLLGVSGDLSSNICDFYLADARGHGRAARDLATARLGGIKIADLVARAERIRKDKNALAKEPGLELRLRMLVEHWKDGKLSQDSAVTLLRLAGYEVYLAQFSNLNNSTVAEGGWRLPKSARLADLFSRDADSGLHLSATVIQNTVLLAFASRNRELDAWDPWFAHRGNFYQNQAFTGFQGFSAFGGQFGFGNLGWNRRFNGGFSGFGAQLGFGGGFGGFSGGFGGIGGVGVGGLGGQPFAGGNMGFSQPFVGGQMGMSFGFNRDFAASVGGPIGAAVQGLDNSMIRRDFADSAFWTAALRTDKAGKASASFKMPDSLTNWRVQVTAISPKLHVGSATSRFKSSRPVMIWPMLPRAFTEGDVVDVFGTVHNLTDREQSVRVRLNAENGQVLSQGEQTVKVPAGGNVPVYWTYRAGKPGMTDLLMSAQCDAGKDASLKKLPVVAATVPERVTASGIVGKGDLKLTLPEGFDPKTAQVSVTVAPTLAADLADTLPYLVEYPYGCVEQTMSRFLPALRVAHILRQSGISTIKQLEEKLPKVVEVGQKRLIALQQPDGGWAWQGSGQTHEMMTPYALFGLLEAEDAGYPCPNPSTIQAGMTRLNLYLDKMGGTWDYALRPPMSESKAEVNDALFCLWVAGKDPERAKKWDIAMGAWFARIEKTVGCSMMSDAGHAFALELAVKYGEKELATKLAAELRKRAQKAGDRVFWTRAGFSRWGDNTTEVTATVMKSLVAHDPKDPLIPGVLAYFHSTKRGDRWDSTKDTACVFYALCDYLAAVRAGPAATGIVKVALNGSEVGNVKLDSAASKTLKFAGKELKAGENTFTAEGTEDGGEAIVRVQVSFTRTDGKLTRARGHGVKVTRTVSVQGKDGKWSELKSGASVPAGSYVKIRVDAAPAVGQLQYFLLESPKPAGFETIPADDQRFPPAPEAMGHVLREDREAMTCFHYEQVPAATTEFVVLAEFAGEYTLPPARGELMYQPTSGGHSDAFVLKVTPKK